MDIFLEDDVPITAVAANTAIEPGRLNRQEKKKCDVGIIATPEVYTS